MSTPCPPDPAAYPRLPDVERRWDDTTWRGARLCAADLWLTLGEYLALTPAEIARRTLEPIPSPLPDAPAAAQPQTPGAGR
jgi:hypothetical protein